MLDEAAEQFQKVEVRAPELPVVHAYLGAIFERRGQFRGGVRGVPPRAPARATHSTGRIAARRAAPPTPAGSIVVPRAVAGTRPGPSRARPGAGRWRRWAGAAARPRLPSVLSRLCGAALRRAGAIRCAVVLAGDRADRAAVVPRMRLPVRIGGPMLAPSRRTFGRLRHRSGAAGRCAAALSRAVPAAGRRAGFDYARAAARYEDVVREALHAFKFRGRRALARPLGDLLAEAWAVRLPAAASRLCSSRCRCTRAASASAASTRPRSWPGESGGPGGVPVARRRAGPRAWPRRPRPSSTPRPGGANVRDAFRRAPPGAIAGRHVRPRGRRPHHRRDRSPSAPAASREARAPPRSGR